jgi:hypothetical protein
MKFFSLFFLLIFGHLSLNAMAQRPSPGKKDDLAGVNARGDQK